MKWQHEQQRQHRRHHGASCDPTPFRVQRLCHRAACALGTGIGQNLHHPQQGPSAGGMSGDQHPRRGTGRKRRQNRHLARQHQDQPQRAIRPDPAVTHDVERTLFGAPAAQTVAGVGKPVLMQRARQQDPRSGGQDRCHQRRPDQRGADLHQRHDDTDHDPGRRIPARALRHKVSRSLVHPHRQPGQELQGQQERGPVAGAGHIHFAIGGRLINTALISWPVSSPNRVPRS